jgi:L-2-hydroxyglutarate oxidase LhgO
MIDEVECAVVGAGVVGLAVARALAAAGREVVVLEAAERPGTETSARNSEVIHAGLYYAKDSLKARLCVRGRELLYRYCAERGIAHRRIGKLVVAVESAQLPDLHELLLTAHGNGCPEVAWLSREQVVALEPALRCAAALLSPSTGILDTHALVRSLAAEAKALGASIALRSPVLRGRAAGSALELEVGGAAGSRLRCRRLINAAGLHAHRVAASIEGVPPASIPAVHYAKGSYFSMAGTAPFQRLIYPLHSIAGGLGIHLTLDVAGRARFGPDVEWVDAIGYDVDAARASAFEAQVREWWPGLARGTLQPDSAGIRPNLSGPQGTAGDFVVQAEAAHGVTGLLNLYGIDSPGLTAALALGELVAELAR